MQKWIAYPLIRVVVFFIVGILFGINIDFPNASLITLGFITIYTSLFFFYRKKNYQGSFSVGIVGLFCFFFLGWFNAANMDPTKEEFHFINHQKNNDFYAVNIGDQIGSNSYIGELASVHNREGWHNYHGKIILYQYDSLLRDTIVGHQIIIKGEIQRIESTKNPDVFDQATYWGSKQVFFKGTITKENSRFIKAHASSYIHQLSRKLNKYVQSVVEKYVHNYDANGIIKALILGDKTGLNKNIKSTYASLGIIHILAISGLHVGILYLMLVSIFSRLRRRVYGRLIFLIVSLLVLWFYAFFTGFSPSIVRATIMFSFLLIAECLNRQTNIYNTIAASMLIALFVDPYTIMDVGFQLSYLAVIGIIYLYPKISPILNFKYSFFAYIWKLVCVSVAAQIAVLPLSLYYFHQFPLYSIFANIIAVPFAFILMCSSILLISVSWDTLLSSCIGGFVSILVEFINQILYGMSRMPGAVLDSIYVSEIQVLIIYLAIIFFLCFWAFAKLKYFKACVLFLIVYSISSICQSMEHNNQLKVVIYHINRSSAIQFVKGRSSVLIKNKELEEQSSRFVYNISPHNIKNGIVISKTVNIDSLSDQCDEFAYQGFKGIDLICWQNKTIAICSNVATYENLKKSKMIVDYLIVRNNAIRDMKSLSKALKFKKVIFDGSNSITVSKNALDWGKDHQEDFYSTLLQGGLILEI